MPEATRGFRRGARRASDSGAGGVIATARGHLVTLGSADEEAFVFDAGGSIVRWIGLETADNPDNDAGRFAWVTREPTAYRNWYPGDPNEFGECVVMLANDPRWADRACDQTIASICERDAGP